VRSWPCLHAINAADEPAAARASRRARRSHKLAPVPSDTPEGLAAAFASAINAGEVQAAVELWTDDATIVQPDGETVRGKPAVAAALQALVDNSVRMEIDVANVFVSGDVAIVSGALTLNGTNGEREPFEQRSSSVVVYIRGADGWRIAIDAPWGLPPA
jgi:uncharacterized protein (TIGR02246 family)